MIKTDFTPEWKNWIQTNIDNGADKHHIFNILLNEGFPYNAIKQEMQYEPTQKKVLTEEWQSWIATNVAAGNDKNGIFKILLNHGFSYEEIQAEMQFEPTIPVDELVDPLQDNDEKQDASRTTVYGNPLPKDSLFIPNAIPLDSDLLTLYNLENFLNQDECEHLIQAIKTKLRPSKLSSYEPDSKFRTSRTCDLGNIDDPLIENIDHRICRLLGIDPSYSEPIQGQYYEVGQEFKPHTDFFEENEIASNSNKMGQRTYTVMIYLNTLQEGGVTSFPKVATQFSPKRGMAVIWCNLNPDGSPNTNSLHHAQPVLNGYKAVITKWFRSKSQLENSPPMLSRTDNDFIPNYTEIGFEKAKLPNSLFKRIKNFYHNNLDSHEEEVVPGDFIVNTDKKNKKTSILVDLPSELRDEIHNTLKSMMESWCGKALMPTYVYGIRVYKRGAILKCHQDRLETHIISAIINIDQKTNEDWPLSIDDNFYRSHKVFLKPGEIIFYEGGRLCHGRPTPLNGDSFANIFCHFKPVDYIPKNIIDTFKTTE